MITLKDMILWNDLPALIVGEDKNKRIIVYSSLNSTLVFVEIPYNEVANPNLKRQLAQSGFFECLSSSDDYISDEFTVILSLTERCNCRCKYCFLDAEVHGKAMDVDLLKKSIDKSVEIANGRTINLSAFGGEPSTEEELLQCMVDYSKRTNGEFRYSITTNGIFNSNVLGIIADNAFSVSLSMDGMPVYQNFQRPLSNGKASYELVEKNLVALVKRGVKLKVRCTITNYSVDGMADIVQWLSNVGVKRIHFEPVTPGGRGANDNEMLMPPPAKRFVDNLIKAIEKGSELGVDVICFPYMNMMFAPITFCDGSSNNRLVVSPRGVLSSCVEVQTKEHELYPFLGLGEYNFSTREIEIKYDKRRGAKRGCAAIQETRTVCKSCPVKFFCGGGCPTRNYRGSGNSNVVDQYRCDIIRLVMPYILKKFYISSIA